LKIYLILMTKKITDKEKKERTLNMNLKRYEAAVLFSKGHSINEISKMIGKPQTTINRWLNKFHKDGSFEKNAHLSGRKTKMNWRWDKYVKDRYKEKPWLTYRQISKMMKGFAGVSRTVIGRHCKKIGTKYVPKKNYLLTEQNKRKRVEYCQQMLKDGIDNVFFSDESKFQLNRGTSKYWVPKGEEKVSRTIYNPNHSIMIWGAVSTEGSLGLMEVNERLTGKIYLNQLKNGLFDQADMIFGEGMWRFQQDNARAHTAKIVTKEFQKRNIQIVPHPPNSPDLNPIESIWGIIKKRVEDSQPSTKAALRRCIFDEWKKISHETVKKTIKHILKVYRKVIEAKGEYIDK